MTDIDISGVGDVYITAVNARIQNTKPNYTLAKIPYTDSVGRT